MGTAACAGAYPAAVVDIAAVPIAAAVAAVTAVAHSTAAQSAVAHLAAAAALPPPQSQGVMSSRHGGICVFHAGHVGACNVAGKTRDRACRADSTA